MRTGRQQAEQVPSRCRAGTEQVPTACPAIVVGAMMRGVSDAPTPGRPDDEPGPPGGPALPPLSPAPAPPSAARPPEAPPAAPAGQPPVRPLAGPGVLSSAPPAPPPPRTAWGTRLFVLALGALAGIGGYLAATQFLPRWWAHRIGAISDGAFSTAVTAGLLCGVVFTLLPLLALRRVLRRGTAWSLRFLLLVLAFLLAVPNLMTLFVVVGSNSAAHAAERTFDVDAPGFRGATLAGAVVGAALAVAWWWLRFVLRRRRDQVADLKAALAQKEATGVKPSQAPAEKDD